MIKVWICGPLFPLYRNRLKETPRQETQWPGGVQGE